MSDRLALANAIEDAGIERDKAEQLAATIFDRIHDNVATKADLSLLHAEVVGMRSAARRPVCRLKSIYWPTRRMCAASVSRRRGCGMR